MVGNVAVIVLVLVLEYSIRACPSAALPGWFSLGAYPALKRWAIFNRPPDGEFEDENEDEDEDEKA